MATRNTYFIPENFVEDEKVLNGRFKKRNFIEACVLTVPMFFFFYFIQWATGIGWSILGYVTAFTLIGVFTFAIIGYNGDSWGETILLAIRFRKNRYSISRYNPRIKTELTAEYLRNPMKNSRAEMLKNFIKNFNDALAGTRNSGEISDELLSDKVIFYYEEDENIVAKPQSLKRPDELKEEAKLAKKKRKEKRRKQKEYLMTLGPRERKIKRAEFRAEELREKEEFQRQQKEKLNRYYAAVAARELDEALKVKEQQDVESVQKQKEMTQKQLDRQKAKEHKKALLEQRRINTLREKEEAKAAKERAKQEKAATSKKDGKKASDNAVPKTGGFLKGKWPKKSQTEKKKPVPEEGKPKEANNQEHNPESVEMPVIDINLEIKSDAMASTSEDAKPDIVEVDKKVEQDSTVSEAKETQKIPVREKPSVPIKESVSSTDEGPMVEETGDVPEAEESAMAQNISSVEHEVPQFGIWGNPFKGTIKNSGGFMTPYSLNGTSEEGDEKDD